jgi:diguanylate cyclase (GGDEF)-like protein
VLQGQFAIGPTNDAEAQRIWQEMATQEFTLARVMAQFDVWEQDVRATSLSQEFQRVSIPLPLSGGSQVDHPFQLYVGSAFTGRAAEAVNGVNLVVPGTSLTLRQFAVAPLRVKKRTIGVLLVDNIYNGRPIEPFELDDLATLANLAAIAVERARLHERVRRMAEQDGLTGLLNRRRFDELLLEHFQESRARATQLSLILIDVDDFKAINDRHGHLAGDDLLRRVASAIQRRLRSSDVACRYGGDEFVLLLPRSSGPDAMDVAEYLRQAIAAHGMGQPVELRTTASIGVAACRDDHPDAAALLHDADAALYTAKRGGRNCAVLFQLPDVRPRVRGGLRSLLGRLFPALGFDKPSP